MKAILLGLVLFALNAHAALPSRFTIQASESRKDGIALTISPPYPYAGEVYYTMTKELCYGVGTPTPFDDNQGLVPLMKLNQDPGKWGETTAAILDNLAPENVHLCYLIVGRGQVEAAAWGFRMPEGGPNPVNHKDTGFTASKDRTDGIMVEMYPALSDFSELYATPDAATCPRAGDTFTPTGRFVKAGINFFNGSYFLDDKSAIAIDLCYYAISKRTGRVVGATWGYRQP